MSGSIFLKTRKKSVLKSPVLPGSKIPLVSIHKMISHIWEDRSQKVNDDEPDLRFFFMETFDLLSARPSENLVFFEPDPKEAKFQDFQISRFPAVTGADG